MFKKILLKSLLAVLLLVITFASYLIIQFVFSKPQVSGVVKLNGIINQVELIRDGNGVPHIFGKSDRDVYFGLGYAQTQDRFFQMDLTRRLIHGRLSELAGEKALAIDAMMRIKGYHLVAESIEKELNPEVREVMQAYTDGVNARLALGRVAPEYAVMFLSPESWKVIDSVAVALAMTDNLTGGLKRDLAKSALSFKLSELQIKEFFPSYPSWAQRSVEAVEVNRKKINQNTSANLVEANDGPVDGSNAWLIGGTLTETGKPILANDPHLALSSPGPFYLAHLALVDGPRVGATLPGAPFIVIGRNDQIAWTNTTNQIDAEDLISEPIGGFQNLSERKEVITIRDKMFFKRYETINVKDTDQGPVLDPRWFDLSEFKGKNVVLKSAALDRHNGLINAVYQMGKAKNVKDFINASRPWSAPMTNVLVADLQGNIGLVSTGKLPMRDATGKWIGTIPWEDQPNFINCKAGYFVTANNLITPENYPYPMPGHYAIYRHMRIQELVRENFNRSVELVQKSQMDVVSVYARMLLPLFLKNALPQTELAQIELEKIKNWNAEMRADSFTPLLFAEWMKVLSKLIYADELGLDLFLKAKNPKPDFLYEILSGKNEKWCDDVATPDEKENCDQLKGPALDLAVANIKTKYGNDFAKINWGEAHQAVFKHSLFTGVPILDGLFTTRIPVGGDGDTVFPSVYSYEKDYSAFHGPGLRVVFDFANLQDSKFIMAPGQSGHPLSAHYRDLALPWAKGETFYIKTDWDAESRPTDSKRLTLEVN